MKRLILSFFFLCYLSALHATLTMQVDKRTVGLHDTVTLTLSSDQPQSNAEPGLTPFEPYFRLLSTSHQISYQIINGVTEVSNQWTLILLPKKTGQCHVPALTMGNEKTATGIDIIVTAKTANASRPSQQATDMSSDDVFIQTQVSPTSGYINQQILYTVTVYTRRHLINIDYTPPHANHALIMPLDQGRRYQTELHGEPYSVEELQYAFFPNQSGTLHITAPKLKAMTYDMLPQPIDVQGHAAHIAIHPAPISQTPFLPTSSLTLSETFEPALTEIKQGDTFIRTITLAAKGLPAAYLPVPTVTGQGFSAYPSAPVLKNTQSKHGMVGTVSMTIPYLFNEPGQQTLPAIQIQWYHPETHQLKTTTLPAHVIHVIGTLSAQTKSNKPTSPPPQPHQTIAPSPWMISTLALLVLLSMLLIAFFFYRKKTLPPTTTKTSAATRQKIRQQLRQACLQNDPKMAYHWLLVWARETWPTRTITHLHHLADGIDHSELKAELEKLNQHLYRPHAATKWHGAVLWKLIEHTAKQRQKTVTIPSPPLLNPP